MTKDCIFEVDSTTSSATNCKWCGLQKWQHEILKNDNKEQVKDLAYWKKNAEENYLTTPISVLRYISELEKHIGQQK